MGAVVLTQGVGASRCLPNCYTKDWQNGSFAGVKAKWDIQDLNAVDWNQSYKGFVLQDLWAATRLSGETWQEWIEVMYRHGFKQTGYLGFGWAQSTYDPGTGIYLYDEYRINNPASAATGTPYEFKIDYVQDRADGWHIYGVYINGQCVQTVEAGIGCLVAQANWIQRQQVGGEATDDTSTLGPTHVREIRNRAVGSQTWNAWSPGNPQVDRGSYVWTWYGDYNMVLYYMQNIYLDPFEGTDGSDPGWPKTAGYWSESGGNIFMHQVLDGSKDYSPSTWITRTPAATC